MYESVFWSSCAASHDDWSISTVTNYIMLKNTWCWSDFYAKFLWSWDLRRTHQDSITETFCFDSNWSISKQVVELDCWVLLNVKSEPSAWTAVAFLGQVALYPDYFLVTSTSALPNQGCIAVSLLTYCSGGKAWSESLALGGWDKLMSNWVKSKYFALVQLIEMKYFNSGIPNHFIFSSKVCK